MGLKDLMCRISVETLQAATALGSDKTNKNGRDTLDLHLEKPCPLYSSADTSYLVEFELHLFEANRLLSSKGRKVELLGALEELLYALSPVIVIQDP